MRMVKGLGPKAAQKEAINFQKRWIDRHLKIPLMALVEFRKAHCFFILPVQPAALAALSGHTNILTPTTFEEYSETLFLFDLIGNAGIVPVILILFTLHGAGQESWYVFGLSTISSHSLQLLCSQRSSWKVLTDMDSTTVIRPVGIKISLPCVSTQTHACLCFLASFSSII